MLKPLEVLKMKYVVLSEVEKRLLISQLTVDEKRYLGELMIADEINLESDDKEMDVEKDLQFGRQTYEDGLKVWVSNKE
tara:strand:- start:1276 stop:1512 length:237 start_codon:yes stop_codon:yes gene_type:complete